MTADVVEERQREYEFKLILVSSNAVVLTVVTLVFLAYFIISLIIVVYKWLDGPKPLYTNSSNLAKLKENDIYIVTIVTGSRPHSGTTGLVRFKVHGPDIFTDDFIVDTTAMRHAQEQYIFARAQEDAFVFASNNLKEVKQFDIELSTMSTVESWYVCYVKILNVDSQTIWYLPCHQWLQANPDSPCKLVLLPKNESLLLLWKDNTLLCWRELHLWMAPWRSQQSSSRLQILYCFSLCYCLVSCLMLTHTLIFLAPFSDRHLSSNDVTFTYRETVHLFFGDMFVIFAITLLQFVMHTICVKSGTFFGGFSIVSLDEDDMKPTKTKPMTAHGVSEGGEISDLVPEQVSKKIMRNNSDIAEFPPSQHSHLGVDKNENNSTLFPGYAYNTYDYFSVSDDRKLVNTDNSETGSIELENTHMFNDQNCDKNVNNNSSHCGEFELSEIFKFWGNSKFSPKHNIKRYGIPCCEAWQEFHSLDKVEIMPEQVMNLFSKAQQEKLTKELLEIMDGTISLMHEHCTTNQQKRLSVRRDARHDVEIEENRNSMPFGDDFVAEILATNLSNLFHSIQADAASHSSNHISADNNNTNNPANYSQGLCVEHSTDDTHDVFEGLRLNFNSVTTNTTIRDVKLKPGPVIGLAKKLSSRALDAGLRLVQSKLIVSTDNSLERMKSSIKTLGDEFVAWKPQFDDMQTSVSDEIDQFWNNLSQSHALAFSISRTLSRNRAAMLSEEKLSAVLDILMRTVLLSCPGRTSMEQEERKKNQSCIKQAVDDLTDEVTKRHIRRLAFALVSALNVIVLSASQNSAPIFSLVYREFLYLQLLASCCESAVIAAQYIHQMTNYAALRVYASLCKLPSTTQLLITDGDNHVTKVMSRDVGQYVKETLAKLKSKTDELQMHGCRQRGFDVNILQTFNSNLIELRCRSQINDTRWQSSYQSAQSYHSQRIIVQNVLKSLMKYFCNNSTYHSCDFTLTPTDVTFKNAENVEYLSTSAELLVPNKSYNNIRTRNNDSVPSDIDVSLSDGYVSDSSRGLNSSHTSSSLQSTEQENISKLEAAHLVKSPQDVDNTLTSSLCEEKITDQCDSMSMISLFIEISVTDACFDVFDTSSQSTMTRNANDLSLQSLVQIGHSLSHVSSTSFATDFHSRHALLIKSMTSRLRNGIIMQAINRVASDINELCKHGLAAPPTLLDASEKRWKLVKMSFRKNRSLENEHCSVSSPCTDDDEDISLFISELLALRSSLQQRIILDNQILQQAMASSTEDTTNVNTEKKFRRELKSASGESDEDISGDESQSSRPTRFGPNMDSGNNNNNIKSNITSVLPKSTVVGVCIDSITTVSSVDLQTNPDSLTSTDIELDASDEQHTTNLSRNHNVSFNMNRGEVTTDEQSEVEYVAIGRSVSSTNPYGQLSKGVNNGPSSLNDTQNSADQCSGKNAQSTAVRNRQQFVNLLVIWTAYTLFVLVLMLCIVSVGGTIAIGVNFPPSYAWMWFKSLLLALLLEVLVVEPLKAILNAAYFTFIQKTLFM